MELRVSLGGGLSLAGPYPGLRPFYEHERPIFFGRERQVREVIKQNERFGALLSTEHRNLLQSEDLESLQKLKESLIGEVLTLQEGHGALAKKLEMANNYLQIIETEGQYLDDELTRVHILSLTDELTELPNRRALQKFKTDVHCVG